MSKTENILDAWIMAEHLSEGSINLKESNTYPFFELEENHFYKLFQEKMQKHLKTKGKNSGLMVSFDIFPSEKIAEFLAKTYKIKKAEEISVNGNKFSFVLFFDQHLNLLPEKTFVSASYYILKKNKIPTEAEFKAFEEEFAHIIQNYFTYLNGEPSAESFNRKFHGFLNLQKIDLENCRFKPVSNMAYDEAKLHSFFVEDLEKARKLVKSDRKLERYLLQKPADRKNLDSRKESESFHPELYEKVLSPKNYPLARYPSNLNHQLSLMQQTAVNFAIAEKPDTLMSINGAPGTGKTTLLNDIFADLSAEQAYQMVLDPKLSLGKKIMTQTEGEIRLLPKSMTDRTMVAVSSNNGAVQNIVNELPLLSKIDPELRSSLLEADYFTKIANAVITEVNPNFRGENSQKKIVLEAHCGAPVKWGLFSMEGGSKANMNKLLNTLECVIQELKQNTQDPAVFDIFRKQYQELEAYRADRQELADALREIQEKTKEREKYLTEQKEIEKMTPVYTDKLHQLEKERSFREEQLNFIRTSSPFFRLKYIFSSDLRRKYKLALEAFEEANSAYVHSREDYNRHQLKAEESQNLLNAATELIRTKAEFCKEKICLLEQNHEGCRIERLDMNLGYEELHLSNPWFEKNYRWMQSELFISALKVRKAFKAENIKSLQAAVRIWENKPKNRPEALVAAWEWINLAVPVISSTFASIPNMFRGIDTPIIGQLFIDEAGQALPQAAVGAIFRSRKVLAVGDPAQIKPVLTLDPGILALLGETFQIDSRYLSEEASVQTLIDQISPYGYYRKDGSWIGVPLWVHRRCKSPMFDISNAVSYDRNMVQGAPKHQRYGKAAWYDVGGTARDKYVQEQGEFLMKKLWEIFQEDVNKKDDIYVISPFRNVARQLAERLDQSGFTKRDRYGRALNVGTVHTFQGKEAKIVFLVLGADESSRGAAQWAVGSQNPNIMNVAATRAKEEFYIIGEKALYESLGSTVVQETIRAIERRESL